MKLPGIPDEVEPIASFDDLRDGLLVWCVGCARCGGNHRGMLLGHYSGVTHDSLTGRDIIDSGPWLLPAPKCSQRGMVVTKAGIARGYWYRVVDPLLESAQTTAARKRQTVRT